ncbi:histidyl-tRNA synthetase [Mycobacterium tuberculosis]|nr:histidyl-tRNA synthetase [Mycobacterium tuberculosis]
MLLDHLSDVAKQHFDTVLAHLDALGVPMTGLVRNRGSAAGGATTA